jgi:hypothetical protein
MIALIGSIGNREVKGELIFTVMGIGMRNKKEVAERSEAGGSGKNQINRLLDCFPLRDPRGRKEE